jgi:uronate dehydrogenase
MSSVLITGATGEVGRAVVPTLEQHFSLRLLSLDSPEDSRAVRADVLDWDALASAMEGVEKVLHLAVAPGHTGVYEEDGFNDLRFDVNVKGTYHVFETARRAGVRRVVHVSSLMVVWGHGAGGPVAADAPPLPVGTYALTKYLSEEIARRYAGDMEVVVLRISAPLDLSDPDIKRKRIRPQQVPYPDLAEAFRCALTAPLKDNYLLTTVVGNSARCVWDLEHAKRTLGYVPTCRLDDLGLEMGDPFDVPGR